MHPIDIAVVILYFVLVIGFGIWYRKRAARDLESYFLGGKRLHWTLLSMSGAVSNFDITGTMWMVSIVYSIGMKSWWHFQMCGFILPAFCLAFIGKWVRRSNVLTGAEWMVTRFGTGRAGQVARSAYAILAVVTCVSFIGYAFQGIGKFAQVYIPVEDLAGHLPFAAEYLTEYKAHTLALLIFGLTTLYVIFGGLYGVVFTDMIQTVILTIAALLVGFIAYRNVTPAILAEHLPARFASVEEFASLRPVWRLEHFAGTETAYYHMFGAIAFVWVLKGFLLGAGGPAQLYDLQRYLAAKDPRDAAKIGMLWPFFQSVRWLMVVAITLLALTGFAGVTDAELVIPQVLQEYLPTGLRGVVIAGLLAAFMSTFSSTVNSGASYIVRDMCQSFWRIADDDHKLIWLSYAATALIVVVGIAIGWNAESITTIWNWIMMTLGAGVLFPNILRWYWWRMNGWGYAAGVLGGIFLALLFPLFPEISTQATFPLLCLGSIVGCIAGSLLTAPVDRATLRQFYITVRPFGAWAPVRREIGPEDLDNRSEVSESFGLGVVNALLGILLLSGLYLFPCYIVGHWWSQAWMWIGVIVGSGIALYYTWYRHLPVPEEVV